MVTEGKTETIYNVKAAAKQTELINEVVALRGLLHQKEQRIADLEAENKGLRLEVDLGDSQDRAA